MDDCSGIPAVNIFFGFFSDFELGKMLCFLCFTYKSKGDKKKKPKTKFSFITMFLFVNI